MSASASPSLQLLPWDSAFFGFTIARAADPRLTPASLDTTLAWCRDHAVRCLYFAADATDPTTLALAAQGGFQFIDVRVDFVGPLPARRAAAELPAIRPALATDLLRLAALAAVSHHDARFFKDRQFPAAKAAELYARWITRDFEQHHVLTATAADGAPAGYVSWTADSDQATGRISLIAVDQAAQGRGLGAQLVHAACAAMHARGLRTVKVATQVSNVPAQRLYQTAGLKTSETSVWFHRWFS